ncbi:TRAP transporter substrate-binding protein [Profundibacterium mesophilum]|uniref:TRAP protonsolute symporter periplasmic substrate-binding protein n=1 Tax=Profundibacterium mesophilum KAUST100406-0324 TaxID=1037889 RepID=A0A921NYU1_9RHOB|nr:TRAP transporter substrate-binding protein [Profundibacterium mesophilum]KAF0675998.1 TRAP protonsolute symporter periplasmic substrate-binding protein [Profundibacterium mesophilum KAUST100406-0324]
MIAKTFLAAAAATLALAASGAMAQEYTFKLHHFLSANSPTHTDTVAPWARAVEEASGGRVKIEIFPSMTLGGRPPELVQQARDGVVDIIWTVNGYTPGQFPRTEVIELPSVFVNDVTAANLALSEMFESDLAEEYKGLEVMFLHVHAGQAIQMRDTEVRRPGDLAGKKLRIPTRTGAWVIEALGASPVAMPVPELPPALQKGVVDGALIPWEIIAPLRLEQQTDYDIEGADKERLGTTAFQMSMNAARWAELPDDIKQAFRDASGPEWLTEMGRVWRENDDKGIEMAVAAGNTHITLTEEETQAFRDAVAPVVDRWIEEVSGAGIDGAALVEKARALVKEHASAQ